MKVGYVLKCYPRLSQTFILNEILAHERAGLDLEIFSLQPPRDEPRHASVARVRAPVSYLPPGEEAAPADPSGEPGAAAQQARVLARLVGARGITHLHAHFGNVATSVARLAAGIAGIPYSFTAHARDIFHQKVVPQQLRRKLAEARAVVTVSEFNLAYLRQHYGADASGVRRIYNGLDLDDFAYAEPAERPRRVIAVGRLVEKKGFPDLVEACRILKRRGRDFHCTLVGDGPQEAQLRSQVAAAGLDACVELIGLRRQDEVKRLVQAAAVLAAPCVVGEDGDQDGLPTVLLEAMALGTPCVTTDVTGIPEVLGDGASGLMVPQHAPRALADALERLLDDRSLRIALARSARALMASEFDIHRNSARIRTLFAGD